MTSTPDDPQPQRGSLRQPGQDGSGPASGDGHEPSGELTPAEIAELNRLVGDPDDDDPQTWEDPDSGAPDWWLALSSEEQAREIDEALSAAPVPESIAAGFTHGMGGNGTGFSAGGGADVMLPGAELAWHVGNARQRGLHALSDDELIGYIGATQRLESWVAGLKYEAVAELDKRRARADGSPSEFVAPEVGAALTLTPWSAGILLGRARDLSQHEPVAALLRNGIIDPRKADVFMRKLELLSAEHTAQVLDAVLPKASQLTTGELGATLDRAIIAVDPKAAIKRRQKAQKDARVETWTEDAGTAALAGRDLDPAQVIAADKQLTVAARWLKAHGAPGTMDQLRAKVYLALLNNQPLYTLLPDPATAGRNMAGGDAAGSRATGAPTTTAPTTTAPGTTAPGTAGTNTAGTQPSGPGGLAGSVNLTIPASAWLGLTDNPGDVAGYGPADAGTCRDLADQLAAGGKATQWCVTLVNGKGQAVGHGCARTGPPAGTGPPGTGPPAPAPAGTGPPGGNQIAWLARIKITSIATGTCDHQRESPSYRPPESLRHLSRGRDRPCGRPPAQIPACGITALGSYLG